MGGWVGGWVDGRLPIVTPLGPRHSGNMMTSMVLSTIICGVSAPIMRRACGATPCVGIRVRFIYAILVLQTKKKKKTPQGLSALAPTITQQTKNNKQNKTTHILTTSRMGRVSGPGFGISTPPTSSPFHTSTDGSSPRSQSRSPRTAAVGRAS